MGEVFTVLFGVVFAGFMGYRRVTRDVVYRCWPPKSCGSIWSPTRARLAMGVTRGYGSVVAADERAHHRPGIAMRPPADIPPTAGFTTLALAQLFNAFNSRSETPARSTALSGTAGCGGRWRWPPVCSSLWSNYLSCKGLSAQCRSTWPNGGLRSPWRRWCCGSANCANCSCVPSIGATARAWPKVRGPEESDA